jgi:hypothetical protein
VADEGLGFPLRVRQLGMGVQMPPRRDHLGEQGLVEPEDIGGGV